MSVLELKPQILGEKIAKLLRVKMDVRAPDVVVMVDQVAMIHGRPQPKVALDRHVDRLVPSGVVRLVQCPSFGDAVAVRVGEDEERVELLAARGTFWWHEVLPEDNFDGEEVARRGGLVGHDGRGVEFDDLRHLVCVERRVHCIEELASGLNVVELNAALST
jgi:hypothetical protein